MVYFAAVAFVLFPTLIDSCQAAVGDSRLKAKFGMRSDVSSVKFMKLYDPVTGLTYHKTSNKVAFDAVRSIYHKPYELNACGYGRHRNNSKLCDPADYFSATESKFLFRRIKDFFFEISNL